MDRKRVATCITDDIRTNKHARHIHQICSGDEWEWPVMQQKCESMMPFWTHTHVQKQQELGAAAAPAASRGTRDTLSLGYWAKHQVSLELSLGAGHEQCNARSSCQSAHDSDVEDTATSSCSEGSREPACHCQNDKACALQQEAVHNQPHNQAVAATGEDDSINSHRSGNDPSPAFCFGCIPVAGANLDQMWPAVEVQAK